MLAFLKQQKIYKENKSNKNYKTSSKFKQVDSSKYKENSKTYSETVKNKNIKQSTKKVSEFRKFWEEPLKQPLALKKEIYELVTGRNVKQKVVRLTATQKQKKTVLSGKFVRDLYTQFPFDDQLFRHRVKERLWTQLVIAKRSGLDKFLKTARRFAKDLLLSREAGFTYMLTYFTFINEYLRNDFFSFAVTKFLPSFQFSYEQFFDYRSTTHALFMRKSRSLRDSQLSRFQPVSIHVRFFLTINLFYYCLVRLFQYFFSMLVHKFPEYNMHFSQPQIGVFKGREKLVELMGSAADLWVDRTLHNYKYPQWQRVYLYEVLERPEFLVHLDAWKQMIKDTDPLFKRIMPWKEDSILGDDFELINANVLKPVFDFLHWEETDETVNPYEYSIKKYTSRPPMYVYPLDHNLPFPKDPTDPMKHNKDPYLIDRSPYFESFGYFFGFYGVGRYSVISPGYFYTLDNLKNDFSFSWTLFIHTIPIMQKYELGWKPYVLYTFFHVDHLDVNFLDDIKDRTINLVRLPERTSYQILKTIHEPLKPWIEYFSEQWQLLPKALNNNVLDTMGVFTWFEKMTPFKYYKFDHLFKEYASCDDRKVMWFPLIYPNQASVATDVLPYGDFSPVRFRRKISVKKDFAYKYNLHFFNKFAGLMIRAGARKRAVNLMRLSCALLKHILHTKSSIRTFLGAMRVVSPSIILTTFVRGGQIYGKAQLSRLQRLWSTGIKVLREAVRLRRIENWQEKNYNYAWALSDEIFDVIQGKPDCFSLKMERNYTKTISEVRRIRSRRTGINLFNLDPYKRLRQLRIMSLPVNSKFNFKNFFNVLAHERQREQKQRQVLLKQKKLKQQNAKSFNRLQLSRLQRASLQKKVIK